MTGEVTPDTRATVLLEERALRQKLVDRAIGKRRWSAVPPGPIGFALVYVAVYLIMTATWGGEWPPAASAVVAAFTAILISLVVDVVRLKIRVESLALILDKSGAIARFVDLDDRR